MFYDFLLGASLSWILKQIHTFHNPLPCWTGGLQAMAVAVTRLCPPRCVVRGGIERSRSFPLLLGVVWRHQVGMVEVPRS
jgi:hypothetical protein